MAGYVVRTDGRWRFLAAALGKLVCAIAVWCIVPPGSAGAQDSSAVRDSGRGTGTVDVSPDSPRASVERFLALARQGLVSDAAEYLELPAASASRGPDLARKLQLVLDRYLSAELDRLSPRAAGNPEDDLPTGVDQLGVIRQGSGSAWAVRLVRVPGGEPPWRFSRSTVSRIPVWYTNLEGRWMLEHLPPALVRPGPFDVLWWQWIALPFILIASAVFGKVTGRGVRSLAAVLAAHTRIAWDDVVVTRLAGPVSAVLGLAAAAAFLGALGLNASAQVLAFKLIRAGYFLIFFWSLFRLVDIGFHLLGTTPWAIASPTSKALLPLGARIGKIVVLAIATVAVLSLLGYPVASLIAGLGIGGLALALAAQKTVENLFGAFSIGVDQPFRVGDYVKVQDVAATVERIGLRSTRFRTLDRTIVTIPNGMLADSRIETFGVRDRIRMHTVIGLVYETTEDQLRDVLAGFEEVLRSHPGIWPDNVVVRFIELAASSLNVEVSAWFQTEDFGQFLTWRQEVLLGFMGVVQRAGSSFAFPTRTVHLVNDPAPAQMDPPSGSPPARPAS